MYISILTLGFSYGEYNEFRDLKRGSSYKDHYDNHRHIGICTYQRQTSLLVMT
jgi:hypothetical protein